jgi:hypothetical protein
VKRLAATLVTIGRIALPYFRSEDRWPGRILLGSVIGLRKLRLIFDLDDEPEIAQLCEKLWSRGRVISLRV